MISLSRKDYELPDFDTKNIIQNKTPSRPSKSLLDSRKYIEFQKIDINNDLLYEYNGTYKNCVLQYKELVIKDILNKIKKYIDILQFEDDYNFEYNQINIFEVSNKNILLEIYNNNCDNRSDINKLLNFFQYLKEQDILVFDYGDLFTYPSNEFLILLLNFFCKIKIFYSKFLMKNIIICITYNSNITLQNSIKELNNNNNNNNNFYYKTFNIYLNNNIVSKIYRYNNLYLEYIINKNKILLKNFENLNDIMYEKHFLLLNYKNRIMHNKECNDCEHDLLYSIFNDCYLCKKCSDFFEIYL